MISAIIPNWNGGDRLPTCVAALWRELAAWEREGATGPAGDGGDGCERQPSWEIIVVDDASPEPGDLDRLRAECGGLVAGGRLVLRQRPRNGGFGATVNEGASIARGDLLLLVNNDLEPQRGFVAELHRPFAAAAAGFTGGAAIATTSARTETSCGEPNHVGMFGRWRGGRLVRDWHDPPLASQGDGGPSEVAADRHGVAPPPPDAELVFFTGGAALIRRDVWDALGGLDETFSPGYWEDYDLAARIAAAGLGEVAYVPAARAFHLGKESMTAKFGAGRVCDMMEGHRLLFELRHRRGGGVGALRFAAAIARDLAREWWRGGPFHLTRGLLIAARKSAAWRRNDPS
jgi:GT2 family glycosyltransferase